MIYPEKAKIVSVGFIIDGVPVDWVFDGEGRAVTAMAIDRYGKTKYGGYTVKELKEISDKFYSKIEGL